MPAEASSFRDPSGYIFRQGGALYRRVEPSYREHYDCLCHSGLYGKLHEDGLLVSHEEVSFDGPDREGAYRILKPEIVPFISYPYEWCFGQLKDAALATLRIQRKAIGHGMWLKDASAYNIQFVGSSPRLIDTLSFEVLRPGTPWVAYGQFCRHFLAPLALMSKIDPRFGSLLRVNIDGVPLDLASRLLPWRTRFNPSLSLHVHLHAACQRRYQSGTGSRATRSSHFGQSSLLGLVDHLESAVLRLSWKANGTEWADYAAHTNYSDEAKRSKRRLVAEMLDSIEPKPRTAWDLGANTGEYSRLAVERGIYTIAWDLDPAAVERNYTMAKRQGERSLLPLLQDLANPSPDLGWEHQERASMLQRGPAGVVLALALIHHLAIGNNVPLRKVADFLARCSRWAIVEFVPKSDSQVRRMLASREDVFPSYSAEGFEAAVRRRFDVVRRDPVEQSERILYLLRSRCAP